MAKRKIRSSDVKRAVRTAKKMSPTALILSIIFIIIAIGGYYVYKNFFNKPAPPKGAISFHFLTLGNGSSGDCIYVRAGENDILIDSGSLESGVPHINSYLQNHVTDGVLEYVIATHGDKDHIAGFGANNSIFDLYKCETIIDFPKTNKALKTASGANTLYADYLEKRDAEVANDGAVHYTALECYNNQNGAQRVYNLVEDGNVKMEVLYNYYYENELSGEEENNYSVCVQFYHGDRKFLFTGDLEKSGEDKLVDYYKTNHPGVLSHVKLYKAGHHGSATSTNEKLMQTVTPEICVVQCAIGDKHDFPRQEFINRIAPYTKLIYVNTMANEDYTNGSDYVDFNGNVVVVSDEKDGVNVTCSASNIILKETQWFKDLRTWPSNGVA